MIAIAFLEAGDGEQNGVRRNLNKLPLDNPLKRVPGRRT